MYVKKASGSIKLYLDTGLYKLLLKLFQGQLTYRYGIVIYNIIFDCSEHQAAEPSRPAANQGLTQNTHHRPGHQAGCYIANHKYSTYCQVMYYFLTQVDHVDNEVL